MGLDLMCFEVHLRVEDHEFLLETLPVRTQEVVFAKVHFERVVVDVVLLLPAALPSVANVAALVLVSTVSVQLVVSVEALPTEATFRVSSKTTLVFCARVVVAKLLVLLQIGPCEELVLVGEDLLVPCTEVTV
jgi:hypothetical protein